MARLYRSEGWGWRSFASGVLASLVAGAVLLLFSSGGCQGEGSVQLEWRSGAGEVQAGR